MNKIIFISTQDAVKAFKNLHDQYGKTVLQFALRFWKDEVIAKDISQEVFLKLWEKRNALHDIDNWRGYLFIMVRNVAINYYGREQLQKRLITTTMSQQLRTTTHDLLVEKEYRRELHAAIESMPKERRKVFQLSFELGLGPKEIAKRLKVSESTVKNQLSRARKDVKERIKMVA